MAGEADHANGQAEGGIKHHPFGASIRELSRSLRGTNLKLKPKESSSLVTVWLPTINTNPIPSSDTASLPPEPGPVVTPGLSRPFVCPQRMQ